MSEPRETHYLRYLADLGATGVHPLGQRATDCLIAALAVQPGERLLEVGCGTAGTLVRLTLQKEIHVDGVDVLPSMLRVGRRRLVLTGARYRARLIQASGTALPLAARSYDAVYTESALGFQNEVAARAMLGEISRVLKPRGRYVANEAIWKQGTDPARVAAIHAAAVADFGLSQASPQPWTLDEWADVMEQAGLQIESADLLPERIDAIREPDVTSRPWQLRLSDLLSGFYRLRGYLAPSLLRQKWRYRRRLARHREDGRHLESRLFVLTRP